VNPDDQLDPRTSVLRFMIAFERAPTSERFCWEAGFGVLNGAPKETMHAAVANSGPPAGFIAKRRAIFRNGKGAEQRRGTRRSITKEEPW
jgi:hypothetical protein